MGVPKSASMQDWSLLSARMNFMKPGSTGVNLLMRSVKVDLDPVSTGADPMLSWAWNLTAKTHQIVGWAWHLHPLG